jgi:type II secretory pathway pseudopilin PulG
MVRHMRLRRGQVGPAFTIIELLVVIGVIAILALLLMPVLAKFRPRAQSIVCTGHLKELGHAFHLYAQDHGRFPMQVPVAQGGSMEANAPQYGNFALVPRNFTALSNLLSNPKLLVCPSDERVTPGSFARLTVTNISYRAGVHATMSEPDSVLSLDRNVALPEGWNYSPNQSQVTLRWTDEMHQRRGHLLFADNRVEQSDRGPVMSLRGGPPSTSRASSHRGGGYMSGSSSSAGSQNATAQNAPRQTARSAPPPPSPSRSDEAAPLDVVPVAASARAEQMESAAAQEPAALGLPNSLSKPTSDAAGEVTLPATEETAVSLQAFAPPTPSLQEIDLQRVAENGDPERQPLGLFGTLAQAGYAVSLLLIIVALLSLYLRAKMRRRQATAQS